MHADESMLLTSFLLMSPLFCLLVALLPSSTPAYQFSGNVSYDATLIPGAVGEEVVAAVVRKITASGIFYPDRGLLHRAAWFLTRDGLDLPPINSASGGIWLMDADRYRETIEASGYNDDLPPIFNDIQQFFDIDWETLSVDEFDKPLYSGLGACIYFAVNPWRYDPIPVTLFEQQNYLQQTYRVDVPTDFASIVMQHEQITCAARRDICFILPISDCVDVKLLAFLADVIDELGVAPGATIVSFAMLDTSLHFDFYPASDNATALRQYLLEGFFTKERLCSIEKHRLRSSIIHHAGKAINLTLSRALPYFRRQQDGVLPMFIVVNDAFSKDNVVGPSVAVGKLGISIIAVGISYHTDWDQLFIMAGNISDHVLEANDLNTLHEDLFSRLVESTCLVPANVQPDQQPPLNVTLGPLQSTYFKMQSVPLEGMTVCFNSSMNSSAPLVRAYVSWTAVNPSSALYDEMHVKSFYIVKFPPEPTSLYLAFVSLDATNPISFNVTFVTGHFYCSAAVTIIASDNVEDDQGALGYQGDDSAELNRIAFVALLWFNVGTLLFVLFIGIVVTICVLRGKLR